MNEKIKKALRLRNSIRGTCILGKALAIAARVMRAGDHPWRELSDADDCELIGQIYQPLFAEEMASDRPILGEE